MWRYVNAGGSVRTLFDYFALQLFDLLVACDAIEFRAELGEHLRNPRSEFVPAHTHLCKRPRAQLSHMVLDALKLICADC